MKLILAAIFTVILSLAAYGQTPDLHAIERKIRDIYVGHPVALRQPRVSNDLVFEADGKPESNAAAAPITNGGVIDVSKVELHARELRMEAVRVLLVRQAGGTFKSLNLPQKENLRIEFGYPVASEADVARALEQIFLSPDEFNSSVANYFQVSDEDYIKLNGKKLEPGGVYGYLARNRAVFKVGSDAGVTAPKVIKAPDPSYTEEARQKKYQGTAVLFAVINENGIPEIVQVVRSLPHALDSAAAAAVARWKFEPAMRGGVPVPVGINIEVNFRLYGR